MCAQVINRWNIYSWESGPRWKFGISLCLNLFSFLGSKDNGVVHIVPDKSNQLHVNTGERDCQGTAGAMAVAPDCSPCPPSEVATSPSPLALSFPFCTYLLYRTYPRYIQLFIKHELFRVGSHSQHSRREAKCRQVGRKRPLDGRMNLAPFLFYCWLASCSLSHFFIGLSLRVKKEKQNNNKELKKYILKYFWLSCALNYLECGPNPCFIPLLQSKWLLLGRYPGKRN